MKQNETVKSLNSDVMIPTDLEYTFRCTEEAFGESKSSGSMMITRTLELASPDTVTINGETYGVAGMEMKQYLVTKNSNGSGGWDDSKTRQSMGRVFENYKKLGFTGDEIDENNPILIAKGKLMVFTLRNDVFNKTEPLTEAQKASGMKVGAVKTGPDGKPLTGYKVSLGYFQRLVV